VRSSARARSLRCPSAFADDYLDERVVRGTELAQPEDITRENILAEAGYEQV